MTAIVYDFFPKRGFGFLRTSDGKRIFFHVLNCAGGVPKLGDVVEYKLADANRLGQPQQAIDVTVTIPAEPADSTDTSLGVSRG